MTTKNKFSVTHFIPLVGPFVMGIDQLQGEFDIDEKYIFSFPAFENNQQHIVPNFPEKEITYLPEDLLPDYDQPGWEKIDTYKNYIKEQGIQPTDVLLAVPPCAGLSMMSHGYGDDNDNNKWMVETANLILGEYKPKVFWGENAPGFAGKIGKNIREQLKQIGKDNGYTMSVYRTRSLLHGVPQVRERSFYFFWKDTNGHVPIFNYYYMAP